jgi:hypothetical protein
MRVRKAGSLSMAEGVAYATRNVTKRAAFACAVASLISQLATTRRLLSEGRYSGTGGPSMTIPAYNASAPGFASIAYVISRARELAVVDADGQA